METSATSSRRLGAIATCAHESTLRGGAEIGTVSIVIQQRGQQP
jgi:hypothetical protein